MPHFGSPLLPSLTTDPDPTAFPQPTFPSGPTFGGDFSDPFGTGLRGPGSGPLGQAPTPISTVPLGTPIAPPPTSFELTLAEFFGVGGLGNVNTPRPMFVPTVVPFTPIPPGTPTSPVVVAPLPTATIPPVGLFSPFVLPPEPVAAPPTERVETDLQLQQLASDLLAFLLQLFGPSPSSGGGGARVRGGGGVAPVAATATMFPFFSTGTPTGGPGGSMPNVSTSFLGDLNIGELLSSGLEILGNVLAPTRVPQFPVAPPPRPTVARPISTMPTVISPQQVNLPGGGLPFIDVVPEGTTCIRPTVGPSRALLPQRVDVPTSDASGNLRFATYKNMGRAILFSGDFAAAKRVDKVASRARRARPRGGR